MAESIARQATGHRRVRYQGTGYRRGIARRQAVLHVAGAGRRPYSLAQLALGAVVLVATMLLAILPARASGLGRVGDGRTGPETNAVVVDAQRDTTTAPSSVPMSGPPDRDLASTPAAIEVVGVRAAAPGPPATGWYLLAATEQGVSADLLRALHLVESSGAGDGCIANRQGSGAIGPFQFKPATFGRYGVDGNGDGIRDICSLADATFSAARYLRALGVGGLDDLQTAYALARYGTDPDRVLGLARRYRDRAVTAS
jgi:hypothetical protein